MVHGNFLSFVCVLTWFSKLFFWTNFCGQCSQLYWRSLWIFSCINKLLRFINLKAQKSSVNGSPLHTHTIPHTYILPQSTHFHFKSLFFIFSAVRCSRRCCLSSSKFENSMPQSTHFCWTTKWCCCWCCSNNSGLPNLREHVEHWCWYDVAMWR